ncbi:MAG: histidine kinase [Chitinophagaceae bacterium]|nr:histidine kinase [Chitinophagaceae bacterium]
MKSRLSLYWIYQIGGWSSYCVIYTFFYLTIRTKPLDHFFTSLFFDTVLGILSTHLMRIVIKKGKLLAKPANLQIVYFFIITFFFSLFYSFLSVLIEDNMLGIWGDRMKDLKFTNKVIRVSLGCFLFLTIWNLLYYIYHFAKSSREQMIDKIRLESLVKELELKTIKSHINPHFIFNALNSIRALVDEDPQRARTAITELSNILRSSMKAEKMETTTLEKELNIVKDYLALELIRFEKRLKITYQIDEDTLDQPVPPMMLQTLVENAIKHGISKKVEGGNIHIISDFVGDKHELVIRNSGQIEDEVNSDGFGVASTYNRLNLLFGKNAKFEIKNIDTDTVEAKITLPVSI